MIWLLLRSLVSAFETRRSLALENLALRQQLAVQKRSVKRPRLSNLEFMEGTRLRSSSRWSFCRRSRWSLVNTRQPVKSTTYIPLEFRAEEGKTLSLCCFPMRLSIP